MLQMGCNFFKTNHLRNGMIIQVQGMKDNPVSTTTTASIVGWDGVFFVTFNFRGKRVQTSTSAETRYVKEIKNVYTHHHHHHHHHYCYYYHHHMHWSYYKSTAIGILCPLFSWMTQFYSSTIGTHLFIASLWIHLASGIFMNVVWLMEQILKVVVINLPEHYIICSINKDHF